MSHMEEEAVQLYLVSSTFLKVMTTHEYQILHGMVHVAAAYVGMVL